jgi:hypothetical protein
MDWEKLIDDEWYYIPIVCMLMLWSFGIGWFLGWVLLKIH